MFVHDGVNLGDLDVVCGVREFLTRTDTDMDFNKVEGVEECAVAPCAFEGILIFFFTDGIGDGTDGNVGSVGVGRTAGPLDVDDGCDLDKVGLLIRVQGALERCTEFVGPDFGVGYGALDFNFEVEFITRANVSVVGGPDIADAAASADIDVEEALEFGFGIGFVAHDADELPIVQKGFHAGEAFPEACFV